MNIPLQLNLREIAFFCEKVLTNSFPACYNPLNFQRKGDRAKMLRNAIFAFAYRYYFYFSFKVRAICDANVWARA